MVIITYQRCQKGEENSISKMIQKVFEEQISSEVDLQKQFSKFSDAESFSKRVYGGNSFALTAKAKKSIRDQGEIIGVIEVSDYCHLSMIFVDPSYQRQGVASMLLEVAIETCKQYNKQIHNMTASVSSNAMNFFVKSGFVAQEEEEFGIVKRQKSNGSDGEVKQSNKLQYFPMQIKISNKGNFHQERV